MDSGSINAFDTTGVIEAVWISNPQNHPSLNGCASPVDFEESELEIVKEQPLLTPMDKEDNGIEEYEGCFHRPEKKRRLAGDQVRFLERIFEVESKLEPEKKLQLAKELGLQPRQVAIWFQNRRARSKVKLIEKDYDSLKASFDKLKADYDFLSEENENLKNEVQLLRDKLLIQEQQCSAKFEPTHKTSTYNDDNEPHIEHCASLISPKGERSPVVCKDENASWVKSDILDSESPHYTDGNYSSSHILESDFSQDEGESLISIFQPSCLLPRLEEDHGHQSIASLCNLGFSIEDQTASSWWSVGLTEY
ncbi:unnamed protein product [Cuscuta epithymum]|uniref:Homeobox-leucine zipper protein n=1 Tax=Cuscuta epithymum TaxID=186058 RepID=A0AAV0F0V8_9ASTE|nr:unnamed protein product [Cuscuta epithymum]